MARLALSSSLHTAVIHDERVEVHRFTPGHRLSSGGKDLIDDLPTGSLSTSCICYFLLSHAVCNQLENRRLLLGLMYMDMRDLHMVCVFWITVWLESLLLGDWLELRTTISKFTFIIHILFFLCVCVNNIQYANYYTMTLYPKTFRAVIVLPFLSNVWKKSFWHK